MLCDIDNNPHLLDRFSVIFVWNPRVSLLILQDHYLLVIYFNSWPVTFFLLSSLEIDFNTSPLLLVNVKRLKPPFAHNSLTFLITSFPLVTVWKLFSMSSTWKFLSEIFVMSGAYSLLLSLTVFLRAKLCRHLEVNDFLGIYGSCTAHQGPLPDETVLLFSPLLPLVPLWTEVGHNLFDLWNLVQTKALYLYISPCNLH